MISSEPNKGQKQESSTKKSASVNPMRKPSGLSLEQWQKALRKQAAGKEQFGIKELFGQDDPFIVSSYGSNRVYRVHYFGPESKYNRCECMDFKTSRLGTCKHIEAISLAKSGKYARRTYPPQVHTSVYVDYVDGRKIKICRGSKISDDMNNLVNTYFNHHDELKNTLCDPSEFIRNAKAINETFEWETDALNLLIEERAKEYRKSLIAEKYSHTLFDGLLKTTLHKYQADGVRFAFEGGRTINADEMGLGKTVQAIATAELLKHEGLASSVIIICPTSLKYQWLSEIRKFTDSTAIVVEGNICKRREQFSDEQYYYKICSFHAISNSIKSGFIPQADMIIYDELQRLKNKDTQMGKQLRKLQSPYVMALSGTPLENKLDELYSVTQLVDQYILGPYYKLTADTTLRDETGKIIGYKNLHTVAEKLRHTLIRRKKADVKLQMPTRTDTNLLLPLTKEQREIHDEYKFQVSILVNKWRRFKFLSEPDRKRLLLFLSKMRMVCDSTFILDQKTRFDTKIDEAMAIINNLINSGEGKVVIFSQWERMLRLLASELERNDIEYCFLHGGVPSPKRKHLIERFSDDDECHVFLSTDAGATGLNLQAASLLVNLDLPWNPAVLEQRIARIYRLGQNNPVQIINMIARDTIEERMLATLKFKSDLAAGILDGGEDAIFFDNNKFDKIVEMVDGVVSEPLQQEQEQSPDEVPQATASADAPAAEPNQSAAPVRSNSITPKVTPSELQSINNVSGQKQASPQSPDEMRKTVANGLAALSKIAEMLRTPESTKAMVDAIVKEDPATGQTSINIPIPDKSTVVNLLSAFSAFLNR